MRRTPSPCGGGRESFFNHFLAFLCFFMDFSCRHQQGGTTGVPRGYHGGTMGAPRWRHGGATGVPGRYQRWSCGGPADVRLDHRWTTAGPPQLDHRWTTAGPPHLDHRWTTAWITAGQLKLRAIGPYWPLTLIGPWLSLALGPYWSSLAMALGPYWPSLAIGRLHRAGASFAQYRHPRRATVSAQNNKKVEKNLKNILEMQ